MNAFIHSFIHYYNITITGYDEYRNGTIITQILPNFIITGIVLLLLTNGLLAQRSCLLEQWSCGCSQLWHSAPPGMVVGCCELRLAWDYPGV